eukprot:g74705.t1
MTCTRIENFDVRVRASQPRILDTAACAFRTCCRFLNISMLSSAVRRKLPTASLDERDAFQFRYSLGVEARDLGVAEAARKWNVTYWKAWYWLGKLQGAHPGLHGGIVIKHSHPKPKSPWNGAAHLQPATQSVTPLGDGVEWMPMSSDMQC